MKGWSRATLSIRQSRVQSAAEPGTVLVGGGDAAGERSRPSSTNRLASRELKGKDGAAGGVAGLARGVGLWAARFKSSGVGGRRSSAASTGAPADQGSVPRLRAGPARAHLVSGDGDRRDRQVAVAWEFYKYLDGLAEQAWWHRGRCLAYGEGVGLSGDWRRWCGREPRSLEGRGPRGARGRNLRAMPLGASCPTRKSGAWIGPRLANLLGLEERRSTPTRQDLFGSLAVAFREARRHRPGGARCSRICSGPTQALLAFIEYLLEWSSSQPLDLRALSLARPELAGALVPSSGPERAQHRLALGLEPLADDGDDGAAATAYVPGLPAELTRAGAGAGARGCRCTRSRRCGCCSTAASWFRTESIYRPTGPIEEPGGPRDAARARSPPAWTASDPEERRLLQDASVLGKTFSSEALAALAGIPEPELELLLAKLVRKEVLGRAGRPSLPRTRPVRLPAGPGQARRLRDARPS